MRVSILSAILLYENQSLSPSVDGEKIVSELLQSKTPS